MKKAYVCYLLSLFIFGTNGVVASYIPMNSTQIVAWRIIIGFLFLFTVFILSHQRLNFVQIIRQWKPLFISGISMGLSWIFLFEAYRLTSVGTATLAYYCGPVLVIAIAPLLFKESCSTAKKMGILLVMIGMILVNGKDLFTQGISYGLGCGLLSAVFYAAMIIACKYIQNISGLERTLIQLLVAGIIVVPYAFIKNDFPVAMNRSGIVFLLILGLVNTGIACYLYFSSISYLPAPSVALCSYLDPLSALFFSAIFLGEFLTPVQLLGAVCILGGAALGEEISFHSFSAFKFSKKHCSKHH